MFDTDTDTDTGLELSDEYLEDLTVEQMAVWAGEPADPCDVIPPGLDELAPGAGLAGFLSAIDRSKLSGYDLVGVLRAEQRLISHAQAGMYATISELAHCDHPDDPLRRCETVVDYASEEIQTALMLTRRASDRELDLALTLKHDLPRVGVALRRGEIDLRRAAKIATEISHLSSETRDTILDRVLPVAGELTTGQLGARIQRLVLQLDPDGARQRLSQGVADRKEVLQANPDGTANLIGYQLPPERATAAHRRIHELATSLKTTGDPRTMDQLRADLLLDLVLGGETAAKTSNRGVVDIRVDLQTLSGLSDQPGELDGYGPVIADIARQIAQNQPDSEWRIVVTDPDTGTPIHVGTTRRRPTAQIKRTVQARYTTCIWPGCRMPATNSDLDHRTPHSQGGPTTIGNLQPLCRHHHKAKHHRWTITLNPDGIHTFTSPLGHTYTTRPEPP